MTFISQHLHYAGLRIQNDILFVTKAARHGKVGLQLIRETERAAKENGAKLVTWHAKQGTALEALLPRLKYGVHEVIYSEGAVGMAFSGALIVPTWPLPP